ncbi:uncharacterized protein BYT42DRAFT_616752 [Radiomyces spectabilis]|uniref:uncharacterized protein n=1 Tax=Radiomyces spectabilis TaxID=64574 RepID=UPI00221F6038|nr:uncharacterized protein BYT42DRAFT_616752 [Radiomyces spectabilis]KAI8371682.1 hypothetical protein BYT42DRAFT_616752 [Radiomyces spectabilis]
MLKYCWVVIGQHSQMGMLELMGGDWPAYPFGYAEFAGGDFGQHNHLAMLNMLDELAENLPSVLWTEDLHEIETSTNFADPLLHGLFDDPDSGITYR